MTTANLCLNCPNPLGLSVTQTTAFCTVLLVTSFGLLIKSLASSCRVQDIPNAEVNEGEDDEAGFRRRSVK